MPCRSAATTRCMCCAAPRLPDPFVQQRDNGLPRPIFADRRSARARPRLRSESGLPLGQPLRLRAGLVRPLRRRGIDVNNFCRTCSRPPTPYNAAFVEIFQKLHSSTMTTSSPRSPPRIMPATSSAEDGRADAVAAGPKALYSTRQALNLQGVDVVDGDWQSADVIVPDPTNKASPICCRHAVRRLPDGARRRLRRSGADLRERGREQNAQAAAGRAPISGPGGARPERMVEKEPHAI